MHTMKRRLFVVTPVAIISFPTGNKGRAQSGSACISSLREGPHMDIFHETADPGRKRHVAKPNELPREQEKLASKAGSSDLPGCEQKSQTLFLDRVKAERAKTIKTNPQ